MIHLDKLKSITHLVTHANCSDGISSALIIKDALPDVKVSFMAYGTEEHRGLEPAPGMLFCDFTPYVGDTSKHPLNREDGSVLDCWVKVGAIVLDHHPTAKDIVEAFGDNGVFGENEKNECGAWLAYTEVWKTIVKDGGFDGKHLRGANADQPVREFAKLAAIRDTWKKDDPRFKLACEQASVLLFWGDEVSLEDMVKPYMWKGLAAQLFKKQLSAAQRSLEESHRFRTNKGTRVCMFQGVITTSDAAELLEKEANGAYSVNADLVVGFHYRCDAGKLQLQFSMRSHTGYDCSAFAKAHGGGGHKAAAGFTVEVSPEMSGNPYRTFRLLLSEWEGGQ